MTLFEKAVELGIDESRGLKGTCIGCPHRYAKLNAEKYEACDTAITPGRCIDCWSREYEEPDQAAPADDHQRHFETGAVRDDSTGKGRFDLLPWGAIGALARHCERGAIHYGERNVDKGIPQHSLIDSGIRHLAMYIQGDAEPHHLTAALWNIAWAVEQELKRPQLVDLPERDQSAGPAV